MTFFADFQNGLKNSITELFPNAFRAYYLHNLAEKLNKNLQGHFSHEARLGRVGRRKGWWWLEERDGVDGRKRWCVD